MAPITIFQKGDSPKGVLTVGDAKELQILFEKRGVESVFHGDLGYSGVFLTGEKNAGLEDRFPPKERPQIYRKGELVVG